MKGSFETLAKVLDKTIKPATQAVAVSLLKEGIPDNVKVKVRNKDISICQQIAYSRMYGWSTYITSDNSHCVLGAACAGLVKAPERVLSGEVNLGVYQKDEAAAKAMQQQMPRIDDKIKGVLTYPLTRPVEDYEADLVVLYINTAQAMRMIQAFLYHEGGELAFKTSGDAGVCSRGVAECYLEQKPVVEIPCLGDRRFAMAQDHEVITAFPISYANKVAEGLEATHKAGIRYPIPFQLPDECHLPPAFTLKEEDK